jgi:transposase
VPVVPHTEITSVLAAIVASVTTFAATNVDDLFLLSVFFARREPIRRVMAGQYLGFAGIVALSMFGFWVALAIPLGWFRFIGCDYHPGFQQIAFVDTDTGELRERRLQHPEEAEQFYRDLAAQGRKVRVGMEASGHARWFERLLVELNFELWIGDAAEIRAKRVRKQKTDRQDAQHILGLLLEDRFPQIWVPNGQNRDLRQLLWHRHRMVQARTRIMNQLQAVALNEGLRCEKRLWRERGREQLE